MERDSTDRGKQLESEEEQKRTKVKQMQSRDGADGVERVVLERRQLESAPEEKKEKKKINDAN